MRLVTGQGLATTLIDKQMVTGNGTAVNALLSKSAQHPARRVIENDLLHSSYRAIQPDMLLHRLLPRFVCVGLVDLVRHLAQDFGQLRIQTRRDEERALGGVEDRMLTPLSRPHTDTNIQ